MTNAILCIEGDKIKVAKLNTLEIFNFVIDFFSERFISLLNIIELVLIKKWVGFSFPFWRHVKAQTRDNHCANLQQRRVDNYVMIYFGSFWFILGHYGSLWFIMVHYGSFRCLALPYKSDSSFFVSTFQLTSELPITFVGSIIIQVKFLLGKTKLTWFGTENSK